MDDAPARPWPAPRAPDAAAEPAPTGIVIAAGRGLRLRPLTETMPKCMLPVGGRPLLHHCLDGLAAVGCAETVVIVGHHAEQIDAAGATIVQNVDFRDNNILHSLMAAREHLNGPVVCSYSDILVEPTIHRRLMATPGDIVISVDRDWRPYYANRRDHPPAEAENVLFDQAAAVRSIGKGLPAHENTSLTCGEFLGLWRMSAAGTRMFCDVFNEIDAKLKPAEPFQGAASWRKSYVTDLLQELVDRDIRVTCAVVERGWAEIDTVEDYERLPEIARQQRLWDVCGGGSVK